MYFLLMYFLEFCFTHVWPHRDNCHLCVSICDTFFFGVYLQSKIHGLQCVAVCCSVLQCVAVCCSALQCVAVCMQVCLSTKHISRKSAALLLKFVMGWLRLVGSLKL